MGVTLGAAFRFVFSGAEVLSQNIAQASGLGAPSVFNPTLETEESAIGEAVAEFFAMLIALSMGAHRVALGWLLESFRALPVGATAHFDATAGAFINIAGDALSVGLRLALPVVAVALATQVALAMMARAAPSLQLFNVGLSVLIAAGATVFMASLGDVTAGLGGALRHARAHPRPRALGARAAMSDEGEKQFDPTPHRREEFAVRAASRGPATPEVSRRRPP